MSSIPLPSWKQIVLLRRVRKAESREIPIHEIFDTISGEGPTTGLPSIFIRVAGCTRTCAWCDTGYSTTPSATLSGIHPVPFTVYEILDMLKEFPKERHLVFTGGEPLPYLPEFRWLAKEFAPKYGSSMETNGERLKMRFDSYKVDKNFKYVVSPKLSSSGKKSPLECYGENPDVHYKFVIADMQDVEDVLEWLAFDFVNDVYIQPVYGSEESIAATGYLLSNYGSKIFKPTQTRAAHPHPPRLRLSVQVHKYLGLQ